MNSIVDFIRLFSSKILILLSFHKIYFGKMYIFVDSTHVL